MLQLSNNLGVNLTSLLRETGNSALEANPRIPHKKRSVVSATFEANILKDLYCGLIFLPKVRHVTLSKMILYLGTNPMVFDPTNPFINGVSQHVFSKKYLKNKKKGSVWDQMTKIAMSNVHITSAITTDSYASEILDLTNKTSSPFPR